MNYLSDREGIIVRATLSLASIHAREGCVPDCYLREMSNAFANVGDLCDIRELVQTAARINPQPRREEDINFFSRWDRDD